MAKGFRSMLATRQGEVNSLVCVGIDPVLEKMPMVIQSWFDSCGNVAIFHWATKIIDATAPFASMYKPNIAFFEAIPGGRKLLRDIIAYIHHHCPGIPVFLDCKRGDIGNTQVRYQIAHFDLDMADGINFSPYMGKDCMSALVGPMSEGKAIVGLCYTSNPAARFIQDFERKDGRHLWEFIAGETLRWADELGVTENAGLVMAAAYENPKGSGDIYSAHLSQAREIVGDKLWFLIPGIGKQGGALEQTIQAAYVGPGSVGVNSSSAITLATQEDDYEKVSAGKAEEMRDQIRAAGGNTV